MPPEVRLLAEVFDRLARREGGIRHGDSWRLGRFWVEVEPRPAYQCRLGVRDAEGMLLARFRSPNHALAYVAALNAGGLVPTDLAGMVAAAEPKAPLLLRPVEAAERLEVSARVVRDLAAGLGLRLHRMAGGQRRYSLADVQRLEVAVQTWRQRTGRR